MQRMQCRVQHAHDPHRGGVVAGDSSTFGAGDSGAGADGEAAAMCSWVKLRFSSPEEPEGRNG